MGEVQIRILCKNSLVPKEVGLQWLIGSPFLPPVVVISTIRCLHTLPSDPLSPDFLMESGEIRGLLPRGFEIIGAVIAHEKDNLKEEKIAALAISAAKNLRQKLGHSFNEDMMLIGGTVDLKNINGDGDLHFYTSKASKIDTLERVNDAVVYVDQPVMEVWKHAFIVHCELPLKLPIYCSSSNLKDVEDAYEQAIRLVERKLRDPQIAFIIEGKNRPSGGSDPIILHGTELEMPEELPDNAFSYGPSEEFHLQSLTCSHFYPEAKTTNQFTSIEKDADAILVSVMFNRSRSNINPAAPFAEYSQANGEAKLWVVNLRLEVLSYASRDLQLIHVISKLIVPAIIDQLRALKTKILPDLENRHVMLQPYHFISPGFLHPITVLYETSYGETETSQVEYRKSLHLRLGLPFDRPLLRIFNAVNFSPVKVNLKGKPKSKGPFLLKDIHHGIPGSGVSSGNVSLIQGSYEYYHYLQDGFDDSGWGCAYRSLQTIISWFRLQHYSSIDVPTHSEIQQSLVEIGDKDPSFVGSRDWIGAIELSFVLDNLLGVSCKIINVRSGAELPEKCRELALHFKTQGTPVMIGGGVLAYTLLGVDYDERSGECAFLILDPHYTGGEDVKKIINGGWCSWKRAVDSKGKHFFLEDKFYNLLLPQRPNMI